MPKEDVPLAKSWPALAQHLPERTPYDIFDAAIRQVAYGRMSLTRLPLRHARSRGRDRRPAPNTRTRSDAGSPSSGTLAPYLYNPLRRGA